MASRKVIYYQPPKPWKPDIARWLPFLRKEDKAPQKGEPAKGWQLWDWQTLKDVPQE